jgi:hypothetical protein
MAIYLGYKLLDKSEIGAVVRKTLALPASQSASTGAIGLGGCDHRCEKVGGLTVMQLALLGSCEKVLQDTIFACCNG